MNYPHITARALNRPLLLEAGYARHFFAAIGSRIGFGSLTDSQGQTTQATNLKSLAGDWFGDDDESARATDQPDRYYQIKDGVAIISVAGTLMHKSGYIGSSSGAMGYDGLAAQLAAALIDPAVRGIMLDVDSPGGEVAGVEDIAAKIANSTKPVWAHANETAASAAYWLSSAADRLVLSNTASVGSIGVLIAHTDYSKALETEGVKVTLIHAGAHKVDGNPYEALPEAVRADFQNDIDQLRTLFATSVATNRDISTERVMATEARMYRGQQAVDIGLADEVMSFDDALAKFSATLAKTGGSLKGKTMSKPDNNASPAAAGEGNPITAEALQAAVAAAQAEGLAAGATAERTRISAILTHEAAAGRESTAREFALNTDMAADVATKVLATVPATNNATATTLAQMGDVTIVRSEANAGAASQASKSERLANFLNK